jgi:hypothetical protein
MRKRSSLATIADTPVLPPPAAKRPESLRGRLARLFPESPRRQVGARHVLLASLVVVIGTAISLGRTTGTGPFQSIWEEDARNLLTDALNGTWSNTLFLPYVGYYQVGPRILAEIATFFPISWAAAVLSIEAAGLTALMALGVYVASGSHLRHPLARFLVAAPLLFSPTAENWVSEIYNRPACIQFFLVYTVFWMILWAPASRTGRIVQVSVVGLAAFSTFLVVFLIPLALLRVYVRRDRVAAAMTLLLMAGAALNLYGLASGVVSRSFVTPRYEPGWALLSYVAWAVPHSLFGWRLALPVTDHVVVTNLALIIGAWLVIGAVVAVALRRLTRPQWLLAAVAGAHSVVLLCVTIMSNGVITQRYLLPVEMLLFTTLAALLVPAERLRPGWATAPLAVLVAFVLVISAFNYRWDDTFRHRSPRWTDQIRQAAVTCETPGRQNVVVRSGPEPYYSLVTVPCRVLK